MSYVPEQARSSGSSSGAMLLEQMKLLSEVQSKPGPRKVLNSELWHACAGPLVSLPQPGSLVCYFPQGHSEQVTASTRNSANSHIPNYPSLPSQLMCQVHNVTLHADRDTDEIYAQMTLQPVNSEHYVFPIPDFGHARSKHPNEFFCKTLTATDTSTHGGFSVPRRAAEKLFPQLDYSMQPPNQELIVRDLDDNLWTFRHIYRGQPKRHLLTTGWSSFVGAKRLKPGDSVLFIRDVKSQLLLGVRRANRQQIAMPSSVLSADSMHIGVLASAAHAATSCSPFTVYYNPRACLSAFIIPWAKYHKAACTQVSIGMRFGMMLETEESTKCRYMGTIIGISDCDPLRWPNSKWRNLQVEWDEHGYGERPDRVSVWEIETPESLFVFPTATSLKRQCLPGFVVPRTEIGCANTKPLSNGNVDLNPAISGLEPEQVKKMLHESQIARPSQQLGCHQLIRATIFDNIRNNGIPRIFPPALPIISTLNSSLLQEAVNKMVIQQTNQFPLLEKSKLPLQGTSFQNKRHQCHIEQQGVGLDCASYTHKEPQEQCKEEVIREQKVQDQSSDREHRMILQSTSVAELFYGQFTEKSDITLASVANKVDEHSRSTVKESTQKLCSDVQAKLPREKNSENSLGSANHENLVNDMLINQGLQMKERTDFLPLHEQVEANIAQSPRVETIQSLDSLNNSMPHQEFHLNQYLEHEACMLHSSCHHSFGDFSRTPKLLSSSGKPDSLLLSAQDNTISSSGDISTITNQENLNASDIFQFSSSSASLNPQNLPTLIQEFFSSQDLSHEEWAGPNFLSSIHELASQEEDSILQSMSNLSGIKDLSGESNNQSEVYNNLNFNGSNGSMLMDPCFPSMVLESFSTLGGPDFDILSEYWVGNSSSNQDVQSQVTSASLTDSHMFSLQDIFDSSGGISCGSLDVSEYDALNKDPRKQVSPQPLRTYTKVQKLGSVGRSIDVTRFRNYHDLKAAIACMFGLEGQLDDSNNSEWKLVYVDYENDVLLVGDDPWEEFVNCVRCIKILSPSEVQQMSEEGMQLMNGSNLPPCQ